MRNHFWAAIATSVLSAGVGVASENDTIRLGGPSAQSTIANGVDTELVRGGHGHGGFHGHAHHGGFHHVHHGGFYGRGFYGGFYGRGFYGAYNWPYYSRFYAPYAYGGYYSPYYYSPFYSSYYPSYYSNYCYPIAGESVALPALTLEAGSYYQASPSQQYAPPLPSPSNANGTFQYDGGPYVPIPMPSTSPNTNPATTPKGIIPLEGRLVSVPRQTISGPSSPTTSGSANKSVPRVAYPAYGE